jgi:hypothetical protein
MSPRHTNKRPKKSRRGAEKTELAAGAGPAHPIEGQRKARDPAGKWRGVSSEVGPGHELGARARGRIRVDGDTERARTERALRAEALDGLDEHPRGDRAELGVLRGTLRLAERGALRRGGSGGKRRRSGAADDAPAIVVRVDDGQALAQREHELVRQDRCEQLADLAARGAAARRGHGARDRVTRGRRTRAEPAAECEEGRAPAPAVARVGACVAGRVRRSERKVERLGERRGLCMERHDLVAGRVRRQESLRGHHHATDLVAGECLAVGGRPLAAGREV